MDVSVKSLSLRKWDVIIIGSGISGSTAALLLSQLGLSVLVLEKGSINHLNENVKGRYPEQDPKIKSLIKDRLQFKDWGRSWNLIRANSRTFLPFVGEGVGGSSALYGMAFEKFDKEDFEPQYKHKEAKRTIPAWPMNSKDIIEKYELADSIFGVTKKTSYDEFSAPNKELYNHFKSLNLNPYHIPMACRFVKKCQECQGKLCKLNCKNDAYNSCLAPAISKYGVQLIENCQVTELVSSRDHVTQVKAISNQQEIQFHSEIVILASGAISTPALLLKSNNLANSSNQVGKNLMRHFVDLYSLKINTPIQSNDLLKQLAFRDLVYQDTPLAYVHSFGRLPPPEAIQLEFLENLKSSITRNLVSKAYPLIENLFINKHHNQLIMASIMEDLAYEENHLSIDTKGLINIKYQIMNYEQKRILQSRRALKNIFKPFPTTLLKEAENIKRIAHICGTCRMGESPKESVVNSYNQSHDIKNLYIIDSSFFPTSSSYNPSLTLVANTIRVCENIAKVKFLESQFLRMKVI